MQVVSCPLQWCLRGTGQKSKDDFHTHLQWVVGVEVGVVATAMVAGALDLQAEADLLPGVSSIIMQH